MYLFCVKFVFIVLVCIFLNFFEQKRQGTVSLAVIEKLLSWTLIAKNNSRNASSGHFILSSMLKIQ